VRRALNLCIFFAEIAAPFIPATAEKILAAFGRTLADARWPVGDPNIFRSKKNSIGCRTWSLPFDHG
jgi:hypothetical protein